LSNLIIGGPNNILSHKSFKKNFFKKMSYYKFQILMILKILILNW